LAGLTLFVKPILRRWKTDRRRADRLLRSLRRSRRRGPNDGNDRLGTWGGIARISPGIGQARAGHQKPPLTL